MSTRNMSRLVAAVAATVSFGAATTAWAQCVPEWSALGTGMNGTVHALTVFDDDGAGPHPAALYAGGEFTTAGGISVKYIAKWDGTSWSALAGGMNDSVWSLTVFDDDGPGPNLPALCAGGWFTAAGGVSANRIAKWDGTSWSALGSGTDGWVWALTVFDDDGPGPHPAALYAGGEFITAGGVSAKYVARWDGTTWSPLGSGMSSYVRALTVFDDDGAGPHPEALYAGGDFTSAGGVSASYVARWHAATWWPLGTGMNYYVFALSIFDDDGPGPNPAALYAGGDFTTAGGVTARYIAKWNGTTWFALGSGMNEDVRALAVFDDDGAGPHPQALYAGGWFTLAGGVNATRIAKWDGASWSGLGTGMGGSYSFVDALTVFDDDGAGANPEALYAGGYFSDAAGVPVNHIARWRCRFEKGDLNCDWVVNAFDIDPFVLALTNPAAYVAQYPNCDIKLADMNCDGWIDAFDIDPFVICLTTGDCDCP